VLCWVALDRLLEMHKAGHVTLSSADAAMFHRHRAAIREEVEAHGYNESLQSYTRTFGGEELDGSLLVLPLVGYVEATAPRMRATCARVRGRLGRGSLIYRYSVATDDGLPPGEGAFGVCSFWAVECLAKGGELDAATQSFEELLSYANDVGLFPEEIDPETGAALGNYPQAFTHVGLINAAITLEQCEDERRELRGAALAATYTQEPG
jgi:GH15 family glucan-1,4-alpha-glucosidase